MSNKDKILLGMLVFVPISIGAEWLNLSPSLVFILSAFAIIPLAALISEATEGIASVIGPTLGGLLNATFGNLTEMVVSIIALKAGLIEVVKASILGSIIANLLLGLGLAMFLGGLRFKEQTFHPQTARLNASSLLLAVFVLLTPSAIHLTSEGLPEKAIQNFSYAAAILLLLIYIFSIVFSIKTYQSVEKSVGHEVENQEDFQKSHSSHFGSLGKEIAVLSICTIMLVYVSEILVGGLEETAKTFEFTELFTGIILLPLFAGIVEYITCVTTAMKNQMDLSVAVAVGSTLQIVLFVTPVLVLISLILNKPLTLEFNIFGMFATVGAIFVANSISSDGQSNWLEGVLLLLFYAVLGTSFYLHP